MEPQQNSKKTMRVLISVGAIIIIGVAVYWIMNNNGSGLLEKPGYSEAIPSEVGVGLNSAAVGSVDQNKSPEAVSNEVRQGLNLTDLGNLGDDINSLDTDINKL